MSDALARCGVDSEMILPAGLLLIMCSTPRTLLGEKQLGMSSGHSDAVFMVEKFLTQLEGPSHSGYNATASAGNTSSLLAG